MCSRLAVTALALATAATVSAAVPATAAGPDAVQRALDATVHPDRVPGASATVKAPGEKPRTYTAGVAERVTGAKMPRDGQVRIGSTTKTFTAVVALQLVGEGKINLDDPVEKHLPNLVRGKGIDGHGITVRQLLQHTSGLPDYEDDVTDDIVERRYLSPRDALDIALRHEAVFAPGEKDKWGKAKWGYSNTNYLVTGLIVEKVTGRPFPEEVDKRVIRKIGLRHTYFPDPGETTIRERHPQGYRQDRADAPLRDVTQVDPSASWSAGAMVSTDSDLTRFFSELMKEGHLLDKPQLDQMRATVETPKPGVEYGLGIMRTRLSCGRVVWGHNGAIPGYGTWAGATRKGDRAASVTMTAEPKSYEAAEAMEGVLDKALCR
ncbi:serine hydrolase domain-containing protein [Streptomyces bambusae]|uniref:Serine hydrolase n=1 Tax=Streptomyces bambusae TaxID=1550616 RepID=A0ABS6ZAN4_9ACTN|nr:serine hydrolase domain-containing protein [Streptomyces bambusae]MBW5484828.1 serine hydrolase [Streptomyces bambusae]